MNIYESMCAMMQDIDAIGKKEKNKIQNFNFRGIDTIYNELHHLLAKHKIFTMPEVLSEKSEERKSSKGTALIYRILTIKYTFYAEDGSSIPAIVQGEAMDTGDKASNKSMSIAHKYALLQAFCIPTQEQKDPDYDSYEVQPKGKAFQAANKAHESNKSMQTKKTTPEKKEGRNVSQELLNSNPLEWMAIKFAGMEPVVNDYMMRIEWIKYGETWRDIQADQIERVQKNPDAFLECVKAHGEENRITVK